MNGKLKKLINNRVGSLALSCLTGAMLLTGCAEGYDSPDGFDAGVRNTQLVTPPSDSIRFVLNTAGDKATISWPLVRGAKGCEVTFRNVDDPSNPYVVDGYENYLVDGSSFTVSVAEDSKYELYMRVIGNEDLGNKSDSVIVTSLSTLVPSIMTIPSGSDITTYIAENPIDSLYLGQEVAIDLEANGEYTMSGPVDFGGQKMTFRGDKIYRPVVKMTGSGTLMSYATLKVKYINFDMAESTAKSFMMVSKTNIPDSLKGVNQPDKYSGLKFQRNNYMLEDPFYVAHCWIKDMPASFFHDNEVNCAVWYLTISDCIVQMNRGATSHNRGNGSQAFISLEKKGVAIKHLVIENSTIFNIQDQEAYFLRYSNNSNAQAVKAFGEKDASYSTITTDFRNTTFSRAFSQGKWWNNTSGNGQKTTIDHCIFHNMSAGQITRRITGTKNYKFNFWQGEGTDYSTKDSDGAPFAAYYETIFTGAFEQSLDLSQPNGGVNFTPQENEVIKNKGGDPRWLPVQNNETEVTE